MLCCIWWIDEKPSIKDYKHRRRSRNTSSYINVDLHNQILCSQKAFLKNSKNKAKFIELLSKHIVNDGLDIWNSIGDADTLIASAAIQYTEKQMIQIMIQLMIQLMIQIFLCCWYITSKNVWSYSCIQKLQKRMVVKNKLRKFKMLSWH